MNQKRILNRIYLPILCFVTVASVLFRTAAMLNDYDFSIGYFDKKGLINTASVIAVCGCILLFTYAFVGNKKEKLIATFTTPATYVPSVTVITALIFFAVKTYGRIADFDFSIPAGRGVAAILSYIMTNIASYVSALLVPLALLSAAYFALNMTVAERYSTARASFGICSVILFALYASFLYFDKTLAINAPNKIVDQMAFIFAALFFLYEIRISLARECWHLYIAFGFIAAALGLYSSLPSLIVYFVRGETVSHSAEESLLMLCVSVFVFSRLILAGRLNPDRESEFVSAMRERADERNRYIVEKEEVERRAYIELYNRMSEIEELPEEVNENELFGIAEATVSSGEGEAEAGSDASENEVAEAVLDTSDRADAAPTEAEGEEAPEIEIEITLEDDPEGASADAEKAEEEAAVEAVPDTEAATEAEAATADEVTSSEDGYEAEDRAAEAEPEPDAKPDSDSDDNTADEQ